MDKHPLPTVIVKFRRRLLYGLFPLSLFVAGYCMAAGLATGGSYTNIDGEPSYNAPVHYSHEFYTGLRWSVMVVGVIMAVTSYRWRFRKVCIVFGVTAALFNPILPLQLPKGTWEFIDIMTFWVFLSGAGCLWPSDAEVPPSAGAEVPKPDPDAVEFNR